MKKTYNVYLKRYVDDGFGGLSSECEYIETIKGTEEEIEHYLSERNAGINMEDDYAEYYVAKPLTVHELSQEDK